MALEYAVEPRKLSNDELIPAGPGEAEFYSVNVKGITAFYGAGEGANHLSDFRDQASAQAFSQHLQDNASALEALENKEPVTVAGVRYSASKDGEHLYVADGNLAAGYLTPTVKTWEIKRYLEMGALTPELAANATTHPEKLAGLNDFDKQSLRKFAASARQDPSFSDFRKLESEFYRRDGAYIPKGVNFRAFTIDNMPKGLQKFVRHPAPFFLPHYLPSPLGGLDMAGIEAGVTLLYSRADAPGELRTGVLMYKDDDVALGERLGIVNDKGLSERLHTGSNTGLFTDAYDRIAAVVGYMRPTDNPVFVAGVGADGKIVDKPQDAQSFGVFYHDENRQAVPVGQAVTMDLAEQLKTQIERGLLAPEPVESRKTIAALSRLRKMLDLPNLPDLYPDQAQDKPKIGPISSLLMHTASMGCVVDRPILGSDADEWQHRAHAHLDRAQTHLDIIARHPAVMEYQNINNMPNMPEKAKVIYTDTLLRKNTHLQAQYVQATDNAEKAQDAAFMVNNGRTDPALLEKANKVLQTAGQLPDIEAGARSKLFSKLISFAQQDQTMRKP